MRVRRQLLVDASVGERGANLGSRLEPSAHCITTICEPDGRLLIFDPSCRRRRSARLSVVLAGARRYSFEPHPTRFPVTDEMLGRHVESYLDALETLFRRRRWSPTVLAAALLDRGSSILADQRSPHVAATALRRVAAELEHSA